MEELVKQDELREKYLKKFDDLVKKHLSDPEEEGDHIAADNMLCNLLRELGFDDIVSRYDEIDKWYA